MDSVTVKPLAHVLDLVEAVQVMGDEKGEGGYPTLVHSSQEWEGRSWWWGQVGESEVLPRLGKMGQNSKVLHRWALRWDL